MNELEAQLRSWTPRRPSPKLEAGWRNAERAINAPMRREQRSPYRREALRWTDWPGLTWFRLARAVAPALACLLLSAAILMQPGHGLIVPSADQPAMIAMAMSNQNFAPYLPGNFQSTANRLGTFRWTNEGVSPSSMRSLTPPEAIDLQ